MNRTWARYPTDPGRHREKETADTSSHLWQDMGRARGTTGQANQRSDTGKGLVDQRTKRDAPGQPRSLELLEGGSAFTPSPFICCC